MDGLGAFLDEDINARQHRNEPACAGLQFEAGDKNTGFKGLMEAISNWKEFYGGQISSIVAIS